MELLALDRAPAPQGPCGFGGGYLEEQREGILVQCQWRDGTAVQAGGRDGEGAAAAAEQCGRDVAALGGKHRTRRVRVRRRRAAGAVKARNEESYGLR